MKFGVVGLGRFGRLWVQALLPFGSVSAHDPALSTSPFPDISLVSLQQVAQADVVFLLVPISALAACCREIRTYLSPETLVVDACSVKMYSLATLKQELPKTQSCLATHPLFGPDSVQRTGGMKGHKIVVCSPVDEHPHMQTLMNILQNMGLTLILTTAEEHDKQMARSQGLVHFIGRGLVAIQLAPQTLATPDFQALLNLQTLVTNDKWQLFLDMHRYNPFAKTVRENFLQQLTALNQTINKGMDEDH